MPNKTDSRLLVALLVLALVARLAYVFIFFADYKPQSDDLHWHRMAENFLSGHGLIIDERRVAYRTPLPSLYFAAIYAAFGISVRAVQIGNIIIGVLTVWLIYDLVRRVFGITSARWSALFACLYPTLLLYTVYLMSETLVVFLIALALWLLCLLRNRSGIRLAPVGVVLGLAVLTRQTSFAIALLIILWTLFGRGSRRWLHQVSSAVAIFVFMLLTIVPWTIRNYFATGKFIALTSQGGDSLWVANNPKADGTGAERLGETGNVLYIPEISALPEGDREAAYQRLAVRFIRENPVRFIQLTLRRLQYFWHLGYHGDGFAEVAFLAVYIPILGLALMGIWIGWRFNRDALLLLLTVPVSLTAVHSVFFPAGRYRLPAEVVMCMLAGVGATWAFSKMVHVLGTVHKTDTVR